MTVQAIQTEYAGYRFRSRLEARWAVFFETLNLDWQYEPEGFKLNLEDGGYTRRYLPDFLIRQGDTQIWVEVKGTESELVKSLPLYADMIDYGGVLPGVCASGEGHYLTGGLLILGPVPQIKDGYTPCHSILQHRKGVERRFIHFEMLGKKGFLNLHTSLSRHSHSGVCGYTGDALPDDGFPFTETIQYREEFLYNGSSYCTIDSLGRVADAYKAARAARFEHGETP